MMLKVAVIGVGSMGRNHARVYRALRSVDLVAICDIDKKVGTQISKTYKTKFYSNSEELILKEKLDAVSIAVPTNLHQEIALKFIKKGISVLIEKPLAATASEALKIIQAAKSKCVNLSVGHIERFNPAIKYLRKLIDNGELGQILSIVVRRVGLYPPRVRDINVVTDLAVHDLDIIIQLTKKMPKKVFARGGKCFNSKKEDHAEIFLDYENFGCFIQANWITPIKIRALSVTGTKGHVDLNYITQEVKFYKSKHKINKLTNFKDFVFNLGEPEVSSAKIYKQEPLRLELESFVNSVRDKFIPEVRGEDGLMAVILAEAVNQSIREGRMVRIK